MCVGACGQARRGCGGESEGGEVFLSGPSGRHLLSWILFCCPHSEDLHPGLHPSEPECPHLFLQQMLATYCLHGSSWLVGEKDTKLIYQEMYHYGYNFVDAVKEEGKRRFLFGLGLQGRLL